MMKPILYLQDSVYFINYKFDNRTSFDFNFYDYHYNFSDYHHNFFDYFQDLITKDRANSIYSAFVRIFWIKKDIQILEVGQEKISFNNFINEENMNEIMYELLKKYITLSEDCLFYILIDNYVVLSNIIHSFFENERQKLIVSKEMSNIVNILIGTGYNVTIDKFEYTDNMRYRPIA